MELSIHFVLWLPSEKLNQRRISWAVNRLHPTPGFPGSCLSPTRGGRCPQEQRSGFSSEIPVCPVGDLLKSVPPVRVGNTWGDSATGRPFPHGLQISSVHRGLPHSPLTRPHPSYRSLLPGWPLLGRPREGLLPQTAEPGLWACARREAVTVNVTLRCSEDETTRQKCADLESSWEQDRASSEGGSCREQGLGKGIQA